MDPDTHVRIGKKIIRIHPDTLGKYRRLLHECKGRRAELDRLLRNTKSRIAATHTRHVNLVETICRLETALARRERLDKPSISE